MDINRIIMTIFAVGAFIGGIDFLLGNKFGFGEKFEEAIQLMPPTAFNMVGIICISPLIAAILRLFIAPLCNRVGIDSGMLGGVLALDMGGYPLAMELAADAQIGQYSGILIGCIFGCTLVFAIPFGMGVLKKDAQNDYLVGVIIGLIAMPVGFLTGGMVVVVNITLALLGSLPFAKLLQLVLNKPLKVIGTRLRIQDSACAGILIGMVSAVGLIIAFIYTRNSSEQKK